ncbi:uncharacterized protein VP01_2968g3 [Puccinia sorghi]|uniref:Uncharacterized protein n=1 Tax=Puccinia sorghi TaxID=27349 RepID=A0A0L6V0U7_9BASI|nr:uncharacterized protein VP01_2968g3 [Puccinia sorghi]
MSSAAATAETRSYHLAYKDSTEETRNLDSIADLSCPPNPSPADQDPLFADRDPLREARQLDEGIGTAPDITDYLFRLDTAQFKQEFCMSQDSFLILVSMIETHPVFNNNSNVPQQHIQDQITVSLRQMGMCGNGASVGVQYYPLNIKFLTHLSFLIHCNTDFSKRKYIAWPDAQGCQEIASQIGEYTGFKNCFGFINGTLIPLEEKPSINPQDY